jgi:multidrug efflux pump subunit AcrA (membrane-fusion protein)
VKKYQTIASLDQNQLQKTIQKDLNTYVQERNTFDQNVDSNGDGSTGFTQAIRDAAKRNYQNDQMDLNNAVLNVEIQTIAKQYANLYSPIAGVVTRVDAPNAGVNVSITDTYEIIDPSSIYFSVSADQTEVIKLTQGKKGTITMDSFPDDQTEGAITDLSFTPKQNETGTVYEAKMSIDPNKHTSLYRLGMTGDVDFIIQQFPNEISVPFEYIIQEANDSKSYVYKEINGKPVKTEVTVGDEYDNMVIIKKGVQPGDVVVELST